MHPILRSTEQGGNATSYGGSGIFIFILNRRVAIVKSSIAAFFKSDIHKVWSIVIDNQNYSWRSDLSKIDILGDGKTFVEYSPPTRLTAPIEIVIHLGAVIRFNRRGRAIQRREQIGADILDFGGVSFHTFEHIVDM